MHVHIMQNIVSGQLIELALFPSLYFLGFSKPNNVCVCVQWCPTLYDPMDCTTRLICPQNSPGKNPGVGCHFLLQTYCLLTIKSTNYFFLLSTA